MTFANKFTQLFSRPRKLDEHAVVASVETAIFNDVRKHATRVQEALDTPPTLPDGKPLDRGVWQRLAEDTFAEFAGLDEPTIRARDKLSPQFHVNRELAAKTARSERFAEQHAMTRGETLESTIATLGALDSLRHSYGDELGEHGERQNQIAEAQTQLDSLNAMMGALRQDRGEIWGDDAEIDRRLRELGQAKRAAHTELKAAVDAQARHGGDLIDATRTAATKATKAAGEAIRAASLLPGKQTGPGQHASADLMLQLADRVQGSEVLRQVLDMLGRMQISMGTTRRQMRRGGFEELVDLELGNDLTVVLPQERVLLTHPIGRLDFYRRFHERSLMQYEYHSEVELKRGPIIFAADGSGSMDGAPNVFCRGLTLAGCAIGNREHRNTAAIEFGSTGQLREFRFPGEKPLDTAVALDFAEHFYKGGTDINQVLLRAYDLIRDEAPFHTADLVIVTDGGDRLTDSTFVLRDRLREMGVKIHGLMIGAHPTQYMVEVCDSVSSVLDFAGPNHATDRLAIDLS